MKPIIICSNFDHQINAEVLAALVSGEIDAAIHTAWEWHGTVKYQDKEFRMEVRRYRQTVDHLTAATMEELHVLACSRWGST